MGRSVAGPTSRDAGILDAELFPFKEQREKFPRRTGDRSENDAKAELGLALGPDISDEGLTMGRLVVGQEEMGAVPHDGTAEGGAPVVGPQPGLGHRK